MQAMNTTSTHVACTHCGAVNRLPAERLTDEDCNSPAAYGYLRWADREMGLDLASWPGSSPPAPEAVDALRAARAAARAVLTPPALR